MDVQFLSDHYCAWKDVVVRNNAAANGSVIYGSQKMDTEILTISSLRLS